MTEKTFVVPEGAEPERIDKYISLVCEEMTRSYVQRLIEEGKVVCNGKKVRTCLKVGPFDEITVTVPPPQELEVEPEDIPLDIVFEDEELMVINKPKGMVVHPAAGNESGTLVNAVLFHAKGKLSGINGVIRPGIVHRLDKDTSGLIVVAKTNEAHLSLAEQIKEKTCRRVYVCLVRGNLREDEGTIDAPIGRHPTQRKKMCVTQKNSRSAVTHYRVLERFGDYTFVECRLETGRTHQIRVHMQHIGHPVIGDEVYSGGKNPFGLHTQALHAVQIGFVHPISGEEMSFSCPIPDYMEAILERLRKAVR